MLRAIIVDDELHNREMLAEMLNQFFPGRVEVLALCDSVTAAQALIESKNPEVVFLDIEMPNENSFSLIEKTKDKTYQVVFVTAYSQYAAEAFSVNAIDYLLKPLRKEDLARALDKLARNKQTDWIHTQEELLRKIAMYATQSKSKLGLPTLKGTIFIDVNEIIHCQAEGSYTVFHFMDKKIMVSRALKEVEDTLAPYNFFRVHKSYLVNLDKVMQYTKAEGGALSMQDKTEIPVSRMAKDELEKRLLIL